MASAVTPSPPGSTCAYTFRVVDVSECPSNAETAVSGTPSAIRSEVAAWRMS